VAQQLLSGVFYGYRSLYTFHIKAALGPGLWTGRRHFLRLLNLFDAGSGSTTNRPGYRNHAGEQYHITVINPWFITAFFGTGAACLLLMVFSSLKWHQPEVSYILFGSLLYLIGTVLVTLAFNVPLNDALALVKPDSSEGAALWTKYLTNWTIWNHIRTVAALAAAALFAIALQH
jgi:uncharacterized membrane protein